MIRISMVYFVCRKEQLWNNKNNFFFTLKVLFIPILNFQIFECDDTIKCQGMKHFLLNNLESKDSLVMKFGQFMLNYKKKIIEKVL